MIGVFVGPYLGFQPYESPAQVVVSARHFCGPNNKVKGSENRDDKRRCDRQHVPTIAE